jgi:hypothetical protein
VSRIKFEVRTNSFNTKISTQYRQGRMRAGRRF